MPLEDTLERIRLHTQAQAIADMESLLSAHDFLIYEHLTPQEITAQYFSEYNKSNPNNRITAFDNVNYCLAVKR